MVILQYNIMSKNTQNTPKPNKKELFLKALGSNLGHITDACKSANIHRSTYYSWIEKDKDFKDECDSVQESLIDLAENHLLQKIKKGDITAIIFYLKTKGKKRGYDEKHQIELTKPFEEIGFDL